MYEPDTDRINVDMLTAHGGPMDLTVERVDVFSEANAKGRQEEKARLFCAEHPLPYIPGKTMGRVLMSAWGPPENWPGKRLRIYVDPDVKFGKETVGGVRVSHVSGIDRDTVIMTTVRRGQKAPWPLKPMPDARDYIAEARSYMASQGLSPADQDAILEDHEPSDEKAVVAAVAEFLRGGKE